MASVGRRRADELNDILTALTAEGWRVEPEEQRRNPDGGVRFHARTFFARAASISSETRAVSACNTLAPSLVMR